MIIETLEENKVVIKELYACGGIVEKDEFMTQIYADVTNREIKISPSTQTVVLGSVMFATIAADKEKGGYNCFVEAARKMASVREESYKLIPENVKVYKKLYTEYKTLMTTSARESMMS